MHYARFNSCFAIPLFTHSLPHLYYLPLVNDFVSEFETAAYGLGEGGSTSDAGNLLSNADASIESFNGNGWYEV